jgi:hypothetical protein
MQCAPNNTSRSIPKMCAKPACKGKGGAEGAVWGSAFRRGGGKSREPGSGRFVVMRGPRSQTPADLPGSSRISIADGIPAGRPTPD